MNRVETAATRPRMASGVTSCTRVWRTNTESMSAAPSAASAATDSHSSPREAEHDCRQPNTAPRRRTCSARPWRRIGLIAEKIATSAAPAAGADAQQAKALRRRLAARRGRTPAAAPSLRPAARPPGPARWPRTPPCWSTHRPGPPSPASSATPAGRLAASDARGSARARRAAAGRAQARPQYAAPGESGDQQAGDRRADDRAELPGQRIPGDRPRQQLARHQHRPQRRRWPATGRRARRRRSPPR